MKLTASSAVIAAAMLALTACAGSAESGSAEEGGDAVLQVACANGLEHLPRHLANITGATKRAGVKTECVQVATGPEQSAALMSGELDVGLMNAANLAPLLDKGQPLVVFGMTRNRNFWDILIRDGYPLPHKSEGWKGVMADLKGARLGVVARGAAAEMVAKSLFAEAGMSPDSATYIATGLPSTTLAALKNKSVDAAFTFEPGITLGLSQGIAKQPFSLQEGSGPEELDYAELLMVTTREYAETHAAQLCRVTTAWDEGLAYLHDPANREKVIDEAASFFQMDKPVAKALLKRNLPFLPKTTELVPSRVNPGFELLHENNLSNKAYQVSDFSVEGC